MSALAQQYAQKYGLGIFQKHLQNYEPTDPLYEEYTDKKGKIRHRKRELPPGLSKRDAKILKKVKRRAHYLDKGFRICGMRFGWTGIIGIIPVVGDVSDIALNYLLVVRQCKKAEIPDWLFRRMLMNNGISAALGFVPIAGDVALAAYKANSRNAALLEEFLRIRGEEFLKSSGHRTEDVNTVRPGAGVTQNEVVPIPGKNGSAVKRGWFSMRGKTRADVPAEVVTTERNVGGTTGVNATPGASGSTARNGKKNY